MIDQRAVIDPSAQIDTDVSIGPYTIIGPDVEISSGTWVGPHVVINGPTRIGKDNKIFQFSSVGEVPQDKKYNNEPTQLIIGERNVIRENCTISRGTEQGGGVTSIGDDNWIMAYVHIAHDCKIGNQTILANNASLAGHVTIGDYAILGGFTLVHQFCKIGGHGFSAMGSMIVKDVPPYLMISGQTAKPYGLNVEGLKRRGFDKATMALLRKAYKIVYRSKLTLQLALEQLEALDQDVPQLQEFIQFLHSSTRGIVR